MTAETFLQRCRLLGLLTTAQQARALGKGKRTVEGYRAGRYIPRDVARTLDLLDQVRGLRAELAALKRSSP